MSNLDKIICNTNTIPESTRTKNERLAQTNSKTIPESNERLAQDNKNNECYLCINKKENLKCKVCHQLICIEHATHNKYCIKCYNDKCNYDFYPSPPPMLPNFKHHTITNHTKQ